MSLSSSSSSSLNKEEEEFVVVVDQQQQQQQNKGTLVGVYVLFSLTTMNAFFRMLTCWRYIKKPIYAYLVFEYQLQTGERQCYVYDVDKQILSPSFITITQKLNEDYCLFALTNDQRVCEKLFEKHQKMMEVFEKDPMFFKRSRSTVRLEYSFRSKWEYIPFLIDEVLEIEFKKKQIFNLSNSPIIINSAAALFSCFINKFSK